MIPGLPNIGQLPVFPNVPEYCRSTATECVRSECSSCWRTRKCTTGMAAVFAGELGQRCPAAARCGYSGGNRLSQEVGTGTGNHRSDPKVGTARSSGVG